MLFGEQKKSTESDNSKEVYQGGPRHKNFSDYNRELKDQTDPETGERVTLLTRKQYVELLRKSLRTF